MEYLMNLGHNLRKIREFKDISQDTMADALGMSQPNYSKLETEKKNKIPFHLIEEAAKVLDVDPLDIVNFSEEKVVFHINTQKDNSSANGVVFHQFSQKMQEMYEARISHLEEEIRFLRALVPQPQIIA